MLWQWFWSSVDLTGNQTVFLRNIRIGGFWSSVDLTGNQTAKLDEKGKPKFWSSVDLTGNQTRCAECADRNGFGAVSI